MFTTELKYVLVRYMLNELGDEAANVGLVAVADDPPNVIVRFLEDPSIKSRGDARVKRDAVARFVSYATSTVSSAQQETISKTALSDRVFDSLREISGGLMRVGVERSVLTNDVRAEAETLYKQLVSSGKSALAQTDVRARDPLGGIRKDAAAALVRAFRDGYGGRLSKDKFVRSYEVRGAKHKNVFDLAVRGGTQKKRREDLFQHLLVLPDAEDTFTQAAGLCWRWEDVRAVNHADRHLTAVLYHRPGIRTTSVTSDALKILKQEEIKVVTMGEISSVAHRFQDQAKLPLGASLKHARQ